MIQDEPATTAPVWHAAAQAQPNVALVKYWGKRDETLNLPLTGSLSITLDQLWTRTRVRFGPGLAQDVMLINGSTGNEDTTRRTRACLDLLRSQAGVPWHAEVCSENNFPTAAGLASSASGFAALVTAGANALRLQIDAAGLSRLARRCSGSAARSIFGGFAEWTRGVRDDGEDSVGHPLLPAEAWPLRVAVAITSSQAKRTGSRDGMRHTVQTSPYLESWVAGHEADLTAARQAVQARDFDRLAAVSEHNCLKMHALIMASRPGLLYWNGATVECLHRVRALRRAGIPVFFTVDAGPQVKAVCLPEALGPVAQALREVPGVQQVIKCGLGTGARPIPDFTPGAAA